MSREHDDQIGPKSTRGRTLENGDSENHAAAATGTAEREAGAEAEAEAKPE